MAGRYRPSAPPKVRITSSTVLSGTLPTSSRSCPMGAFRFAVPRDSRALSFPPGVIMCCDAAKGNLAPGHGRCASKLLNRGENPDEDDAPRMRDAAQLHTPPGDKQNRTANARCTIRDTPDDIDLGGSHEGSRALRESL